MNCPLCHVALKATGHRGVGMNYCPLCGGTWLGRYGFDNLLPTVSSAPRARRRMLCIAIITAIVLVGCLVATVTVR
jgi:Zn-finger nucleic acid-binding protein